MKKFLAALLLLTLSIPASAQNPTATPVTCSPGTPCTTTGPSATGTGMPLWLAFGTLNNTNFTPQTAAELTAGVTPTATQFPPGDVRRYGAKGDGLTNDQPAIQNAVNAASLSPNRQSVYLAGGANYRLQTTLVIPPTVYVYGLGASPDSNVGWGARFTCDLAVTPCVQLGQSGGSPGAGLSYVSIWRAPGTIPTGAIGLKVLDGGMVSISHVAVMRNAIGVDIKADTVAGGLGLNIDNLNVGIVSDAYIVEDTWAEVRIVNSRFGSNGNDIAANTFVRFTGGSSSGPGAGPNTFYVANTQFNASPVSPTHWLEFVNQTVGIVSPPEDFKFVNCHVEGLVSGTGAFVFSDSSWPSINGLAISNSWFSPDVGGTTFFALNAATSVANLMLSNNDIATALTLAPTNTFTEVEITGNDIAGNVSITGASGSQYVSTGNLLRGNLTYAGNFARLRSDDQLLGTFSFSATGTFSQSIDLTGSSFAKGSWTPVITFGGGTTGQTYSRQAGTYQIVGELICASWQNIFTAVGSSTGAALLTGLPFPVANQIAATGGGGAINFMGGASGLTSIATMQANQGASTINLYQSGASGYVQLTNANFTNTTNIAGMLCYEWQ